MAWVLALLLALLGAPAAAGSRPHVYLVVIDGLAARYATAAHMPRLTRLVEREAARSTFYRDALAVMPARTNPNYVSLLTGVYPEVHGITGNSYWSRERGTPPRRLDEARLIEAQTLFTIVDRAAPELETVGVFAKPKLAQLFSAVPGRQAPPDRLWDPDEAPRAERDPATGYAFDGVTMDAFLALVLAEEPDFGVVALVDVDRTAHRRGPDDPAVARAIAGADAAVGRLADALRAAGRWQRSVIVVVADHGFDAVAPTDERPEPVIVFGRELARAGIDGILPVSEGGFEHVYWAGPGDASGKRAAATLADVARLARRTPGIVGVFARRPVPGVALVEAVHPDWHLAGHERAGDLMLVAARGYQFVDPFSATVAALRGDHGGPGDREVPLVVTGGWTGLRAASPAARAPSVVDVAPTIGAWLGLPPSQRLDGRAIPEGERGHPIAAVMRAGATAARTD